MAHVQAIAAPSSRRIASIALDLIERAPEFRGQHERRQLLPLTFEREWTLRASLKNSIAEPQGKMEAAERGDELPLPESPGPGRRSSAPL